MIDKNTMIMAWTLDGKNWVNEKWRRLPLSRTRSQGLISYTKSTTPPKSLYNADAPDYNIDKDSLAIQGYDLTEYFINNKASKSLSKY